MTNLPSQPPQFGAPVPPPAGAPVPPQFGAQVPPAYGAPAQPPYGAPAQPAYGGPVPPPQFGAPQPQYGAPAQTGAPAQPGAPVPPQPYGAPQPQYGAPQPQLGAPVAAPNTDFGPNPGYIVLTLQGNVMTSSMIVPQIRVDGWPVPSQYGQNVIPVAPGAHTIYVSGQWMREYGQATLAVEVRPGEHLPVFYRAPMHQFTTGSIGLTPQKARGKGVFWGIMGGLAAVIVGSFVLLIASAMS